jgi:hypothetical protein
MLRPGPRNQTSEVVRFVLWLTVVVALAVAWWIDRSEGESRAVRIQQRADAAAAKAEKRLFELELLAGDEERFRQLKELKAKLAAEDLVAKRAAERKGSD